MDAIVLEADGTRIAIDGEHQPTIEMAGDLAIVDAGRTLTIS